MLKENFHLRKSLFFFQTFRSWLFIQVIYPAELSSPTCLSCPVPVVWSQMSRSRCPVLTCLSCPGCPVPSVLFQLPSPSNPVHSSPGTTVMSWQSCHPYPFQAHLFRLTFPDCPVLTVLSWLSCPALL
jgi:hypothetical protein